MSLVLHYHPLSSFCWKVLIALYEHDAPFEPRLVDLGDPASRAALAALWPMAKMPVLEDRARGQVIPETTLIIDYLEIHHSWDVVLIPDDPDEARDVLLWDRIFDNYVQGPMQKIVHDRLRPATALDDYGVAEARARLAAALAMVEDHVADRRWTMGDDFTLADCAAAPALFYADKVMPLAEAYPHATALLERLKSRPSFARVLVEAEPWFAYFPGE